MSKDKEKHNAYMREYMKRYLASMTDAERSEWNAMKRANAQKRGADPSVRARRNASAKKFRDKRLAIMTPAERSLANERKAAYERRRLEDPAARAARRASASRYSKAKYEKISQYQKDYKIALKVEMLAAYGPDCACCGEPEATFLTLDHVKGNGSSHRKATKRGAGYSMYLYLKRLGWPSGFQVLCFNCNFAKKAGPSCPHEGHYLKLVTEPRNL